MHAPDHPDDPRHKWLKWVGLEPEPPDPDEWVPVPPRFAVDDLKTGSSETAEAVAAALRSAGIDAHQRTYVVPDNPRVFYANLVASPGRQADERIKVAVLVHNRDLERAVQQVAELRKQHQILDPEPISDEELTRLSLEAGEKLEHDPEGRV